MPGVLAVLPTVGVVAMSGGLLAWLTIALAARLLGVLVGAAVVSVVTAAKRLCGGRGHEPAESSTH